MSGPAIISNLYDPSRVRALFDEMSATYGLTNLISSFGFCAIWRRQCVKLLPLTAGITVYDLMCGMGECFPLLAEASNNGATIVGLDFSPVMCASARSNTMRLRCATSILEEDVLANSLVDGRADAIISTFGLKTFSSDQRKQLAVEVVRILKLGGHFAFLEISSPRSRILRSFYLFYLRRVIPLIGKMLLGNPDNYRMLGVYTEGFGDCRETAEFFREAGLVVEERAFFFGCASGVWGRKAA